MKMNNNNKSKYLLPRFDIVSFELDEIITTSPGGFTLFGADIGDNDPGVYWPNRN